MENNPKFFWIDAIYNHPLNKKTIETLKKLQKKYNFQFTPFSDLDKAIEEIKKIKSQTVFVMVSGRFYQDYYLKLKELKSELTCKPICLIYTSAEFKNILENRVKNEYILDEIFESIGDKFYNWGGVADHPEDIIKFLDKYSNIKEPI